MVVKYLIQLMWVAMGSTRINVKMFLMFLSTEQPQ